MRHPYNSEYGFIRYPAVVIAMVVGFLLVLSVGLFTLCLAAILNITAPTYDLEIFEKEINEVRQAFVGVWDLRRNFRHPRYRR